MYTAEQFINELTRLKVPRKQIATNDFSCSIPAIYITIPYGKPGGGRYRKYHRWEKRDVINAHRFYLTGEGKFSGRVG